MREKNRAGRRLTWASAMLLILCLISGSVLAGYLIRIAGADKNLINLDGTPGRGLMLTESRKLTVGAAKSLGFEAIGDGEEEAWSTETPVEIFHISYDKDGQVTVKSENTDKLIAPGTENSYSFRLKNPTSSHVDYSMWVEAKVEPETAELPLNVRMSGKNGTWLLGSESEWKRPLELNNVKDEGRLNRSESSSYTLTWQWPFEQGNDELDTLLGNRAENENLSFSIVIHTIATGYEGGGSGDRDDDGNGGGGNSGISAVKPGPGAETTAPSRETAGSNETTGANETAGSKETTGSNESGTAETTAPTESGSAGTSDGSEETNGNENRPSGEDHGTANGNSGNQGQNNDAGDRNDNGSSGSQNGTNGNSSQNAKDHDSDKNEIRETTASGENTENGDGKETAADGTESRRGKLPWWLWPAGLIGLLLLLLVRRRIYVTGFVTGMTGSDMNWRREKDRIRPDGRFVFEKMPFGTHTFTVTAPDGTEKAKIDWKLKRDNAVTGVRIEKKDGTYTVYAGKHVRAIELYFDADRGELSLRPSKWAAIDTDKNVYTPTGKAAPLKDGTNETPGGLLVDKEKKLHIDRK